MINFITVKNFSQEVVPMEKYYQKDIECASPETKDQINEHDREDHEIGHVKQAEEHIRNLLRLHRLLPPWTARSGQ